MAKSQFPRLHKAVRYAVKAHRKQDRDGNAPLPYITHPMEVLTITRYMGDVVDEDVLCAAVLHDLVEESDVTVGDIEKKFGERVATLVRQLTREEPDAATSEGMSETEIWKLRNALMMKEIDAMSDEAKLIKLADRYSNLRTAGFTKPADKLKRYTQQSKEILKRIDRSVAPKIWDELHLLAEPVVKAPPL